MCVSISCLSLTTVGHVHVKLLSFLSFLPRLSAAAGGIEDLNKASFEILWRIWCNDIIIAFNYRGSLRLV